MNISKYGDKLRQTMKPIILPEQKEQFDAMEKSTAALLKALEEADQASSEVRQTPKVV